MYPETNTLPKQPTLGLVDRPMRDTLIECCTLDWSKISPAIFGAMFQSVMNDE
jgi:hypothetical protein